jgi:hypothetical protein
MSGPEVSALAMEDEQMNEVKVEGLSELKFHLEQKSYIDYLMYSAELRHDPLGVAALGEDVEQIIVRFKCYLLETDSTEVLFRHNEPATWRDYVKHGLRLRWPRLFSRVWPAYIVKDQRVQVRLCEVFPSEAIDRLRKRFGPSHPKFFQEWIHRETS